MGAKSLLVFASGQGSLFQFLFSNYKDLGFQNIYLVTNKVEAPVALFAKNKRVKIIEWSSQVIDQLIQEIISLDVALIMLAGLTQKIPLSLIQAFPEKIINTHPSLLPKYGGQGMYGLRVHQEVLAAKERESGCTTHFVSEEYDSGKIISQMKISVSDEETPESLQNKVKKLEKENILHTLSILMRS